MSKRLALGDALQGLSTRPRPASDLRPADDEEIQPAPVTAARPPSRRGTKTIAGHFSPEASKLLRQIAVDEDSSVQDLLREALNDLFAKRGKPRIA
jgi:hypothetical protein